jgi:hypothetical protein
MTQQKIENGQGTIYHELGHLIAYCLSNRNAKTALGEILSFEVGFKLNRVAPKQRIYHVENILLQREEIKSNTSNIERTVAWFIEVIAGCTFQVVFEKKDFNLCFGNNPKMTGYIDLSNLSVIRNISYFRWTFDDIYSLQKDLQTIIEKYNVVENLNVMVENLKLQLLKSENNQLEFRNNDLKNIEIEVEKLIGAELEIEYFSLIEKFKKIFEIASY